MKLSRLIIRLTVYLLPFAVVIGLSVGISVTGGEAMPLSMVYSLQFSDPEVIYMPIIKGMNLRYKLYMIPRVDPDIVILGNSVMRYVRADDFDPSAGVFYNAFLPGARGNEISVLIEQLRRSVAPRTVLIGIALRSLSIADRGSTEDNESNVELTISDISFGTRITVRQLLMGHQTLAQILSRTQDADAPRLGITATLEGFGFRFDGSQWHHATALRTYEESLSAGMEARREYYEGQVVSGRMSVEIDPELFDRLLADIASLKAAGSEVVVITVPFLMPSLIEVIPGTPLETQLNAARRSLADALDTLGVEFYEFHDPRTFGLTDEDMPDAIHMTPEATSKMIAVVLAQSPALRQYAPAGF